MSRTMTRSTFFKKKLRNLGRAGMVERYGCPHWALREWAEYNVRWRGDIIIYAREHRHDTRQSKRLEFVKSANAGIAKMAMEYQKAIVHIEMIAS